MGIDENRFFCFRFDVDTHRCIQEGVPNLLSLFNRMDVRATFFVNPGRAVSVFQSLKHLLFGKTERQEANKLSGLRKLGLRGYVVASLLNPEVGAGHPELVRQIEEEGHEVAVHGGKNHAEWMYGVQDRDRASLERDVRWGMKTLSNCLRQKPRGFGSPGWNEPEGLTEILFDLGFDYQADHHGPEGQTVERQESGPISIPTNFTGEPGGVGYLEHLRARNFSGKNILERFTSDLNKKQRIGTFFEHPFYAGIQELDLLREIISIVKNSDFHILTYDDVVDLPLVPSD